MSGIPLCQACSNEKHGVKTRVAVEHTCDKEQLYKAVMDRINNPKPLEKPPFACPVPACQKNNNCQYPNCLCEWKL